jgi:tRNA G18 (ribose-2'-O)-methylase SpoU
MNKTLLNNQQNNIVLHYNSKSNLFKVPNWIKDNHIYIKHESTNNYIYYDYETFELKLSETNKTLFELHNYKENIPDHVSKILTLAKNKEVKIKHVSRDRLDKLTGGRPHNGVVLKSDIREYIYVNSFSFLEKFLPKQKSNLI